MAGQQSGLIVNNDMVRTGSLSVDPLISVIVATFNNEGTVRHCIDSVAGQTYLHTELIIIDGGSTDGTVKILQASAEKIAFWVSEPDRGIYHAWNKGLPQATGEWICFLGADDFFWETTVLARIAEQLGFLSPNIRVVYGQNMLVTTEGENHYPMGAPWASVKDKFLAGTCLPHPGMMHHRSLFDQYGPFDESFRIAGDYEMLLRELKTADALFVPNLIIAGVRQGGISSNPDSALLILSETRRAQRRHGQRFPPLYWMWSVIKVSLRLLLWRVFGERVARNALDLGRQMLDQPRHWTKT